MGKNKWLKDALYLDNSNAASFSSIGDRGGKLLNFLTFFGHFGGSKWPPGGSEGGWVKKIFHLKMRFT